VDAPLVEKNNPAVIYPARYADLLLIIAAGLFLACFTIVGTGFSLGTHDLLYWPIQLGRVLLGLPFVLYIPGYLLQGIFFAKRDDLDSLERMGLSLGLSVALVALLALLLNALPWGLSISAILVGQGCLVLLLIILSALVRRLQPTAVDLPASFTSLSAWWVSLQQGERRMLLVMAAALLFTLFTAAWIFLVPSSADYMTEFYMLGPEGLAQNFPRQASMGQLIGVTLAITNRERASMQYRVEVWQVDPLDGTHRQLVAAASPFTLSVGESHQRSQTWQPAWPGQDQQFELLLYTATDPDPYRQLLLWMNIVP
jgi:uncharacterized membrane protein